MEKVDHLRYTKKEKQLVLDCKTPNEFFRQYDMEFPDSARSTVSRYSLWNSKSNFRKELLKEKEEPKVRQKQLCADYGADLEKIQDLQRQQGMLQAELLAVLKDIRDLLLKRGG